jgi:hypothetical protein
MFIYLFGCQHKLILLLGCNICGNFDICSPCYDKGRRCQNNSHKTHPRRSLVGTEAGNCRRTLRPPHARFRIPCNSCKKFINSNTHGSVYFRMSNPFTSLTLKKNVLFLTNAVLLGFNLTCIYADCCLCDSDNYDLCFDCVVVGHTCPDPSHLLQVMAA